MIKNPKPALPLGRMFLDGLGQALFLTPPADGQSIPDLPISPEEEILAQQQWAESRELYRETSMVRVGQWIDAVLARLEGKKGQRDLIAVLTKAVRESGQTLEGLHRKYCQALAARANAEERLRQEFLRLKSFPKVRGLTLAAEELKVQTAPLIIRARDGSKWGIGHWEITIPRQARLEAVRCRSLRDSPRYDGRGWQHPHVDGGGGVCWGNFSYTMRRALERSEYDVVIELAITLLEQGREYDVNGHDYADYSQRLMQIADRVR